jgi:hypothetical protein
MPAEVKDRVHGLARRANAHQGLTFTDGHGNNLDALYPDDDDDSDYDPDDAASTSSASSTGSDSSDSDYDPNAASTSSCEHSHDAPDGTNIPDLAVPMPAEIAGVDPTINTVDDNNPPGTIPGVDDNNPPGNIPGVDDKTNDHPPEETAGVDDEIDPALETYVNELEAKFDQGIADLDSDYTPDESDDESTRADATREQASAANDARNDPDDNNGVPALLPRLRRNRTPNYGHLKGRDGDGSLPTVARPEEFRGSRHQSHIILQSIIMT